jgi:hypothetical protein
MLSGLRVVRAPCMHPGFEDVHLDLVLLEEVIAPSLRLDKDGAERGDECYRGDEGDQGEAEGRLERRQGRHGVH